MDTIKIGDYIRSKREFNGWNQEELAEKVGVSQRTIHNWEAGKVDSIKVANLEKLAEAFGVSFVEVYNGKDMPELDETVKESLSQTIIPILETVEERGLLALEMGSFAVGLALIAFSIAWWCAFSHDVLSSLMLLFVALFGCVFIFAGKYILKKKPRVVSKLKHTKENEK